MIFLIMPLNFLPRFLLIFLSFLKWSYSSTKGFYIGFKAKVVIDLDSRNLVCILIHSGAKMKPNSWRNYGNSRKKTNNTKRGHVIFDKEHYDYNNYQLGISKYKIVLFISLKENFNRTKLNDQLFYPLQLFK